MLLYLTGAEGLWMSASFLPMAATSTSWQLQGNAWAETTLTR